MANVAHASLTGADLHEPKGIGSASINTAYFSNGAGTGTWSKVNVAKVDTTSILNVNKDKICFSFVDVSNPSSIWIPIPDNCTINKVSTCLQGAITVADSTLTCYNNAGSSMGTITVSFTGSAAGDVDTLSPASNNTFLAGQTMKITTDGNSTTTAALNVIIDLTYS
jgi:hypothetical protein